MEKLLEIRNLKTHFFSQEGVVRAVDGVSFSVHRGRNLGILGESGCGKSVLAQSILRLIGSNGQIVEGEILLNRDQDRRGQVDLVKLDPEGREMREIRGREIAMIFQEPMTSLSPVHTIGEQIMEAILLHQYVTSKEARLAATQLHREVGIPGPEQRIDDYPHQLSGGMRQRAMIAMALSCRPRLLIADEPTTALDVTVQAQILNLIRDLQNRVGMTVIMITHDLGVIAETVHEVVVMYLGRIAEKASVEELFYDPRHPYTKGLLRSIPRVEKRRAERLHSIKGMVPHAYNVPPGCAFHPRCPDRIMGKCDAYEPPLIDLSPSRTVRCFLYE